MPGLASWPPPPERRRLTLLLEARDDVARVHAELDDLERHLAPDRLALFSPAMKTAPKPPSPSLHTSV
jgi:hypothetical protein